LTFIVLAGHVFLAVVFPPTRPALRGMLTGWVDRTWARRHYARWVVELDGHPEASRSSRL
jgi:formate dehydrogenase subunit gamma